MSESPRAIFLSYATEDSAEAARLAAALRSAGVDVWFDQNELRGGDAWDHAIRRQIRECALFVPLISAQTAGRREGYFRLEWALADARSQMMARDRPFIVPVCLDRTPESGTDVPDSFQRVQWMRLNGGQRLQECCARLQQLLGAAAPPPADPAAPASKVATPMLRGTRRSRAQWMAGVGLLAGALIATTLLMKHGGVAAVDGTAAAAGDAASRPAPSTLDRSFAVLPFVNLSRDPDQEYFSDGLTEEITSALAKIPDLKVVGRTSAFQFKGKNEDLVAIGAALKAHYLLEGSVRKSGQQLRITAQLIEAGSGVHLWTDSYDRRLTDIFAIQEEIARSIANAMKVPLGLGQGEQLVSSRPADLDSYELYLRARALVRARRLTEAIALLKPAVQRDPGYAPAWGLLAFAYTRSTSSAAVERELRHMSNHAGRTFLQGQRNQGEDAAGKALALDPRQIDASIALGALYVQNGHWLEADEQMRRTLATHPNDPDALLLLGFFRGMTGFSAEALEYSQHALAIEPFVPVFNFIAALALQENGRYADSIPLLKTIPAQLAEIQFPSVAALAEAQAMTGRYAEAADTVEAMTDSRVTREEIAGAAHVLRALGNSSALPAALPDLPVVLMFVYARAGADERVLRLAQTQVAQSATNYLANLWTPTYASLRRTAQFKSVVRDAGLVDYWRQRGWPDHCRPQGTDDFTCD